MVTWMWIAGTCLAAAPTPEAVFGRDSLNPKPSGPAPLALETQVTHTEAGAPVLGFSVRNTSDDWVYVADGLLANHIIGTRRHELSPSSHFTLVLFVDGDAARPLRVDYARTEGTASGVRHLFRVEPGDAYTGTVAMGDLYVTDAAGERHHLGVDAKHYTLKLRYRANPHFSVLTPENPDMTRLWRGVIWSAEQAVRMR